MDEHLDVAPGCRIPLHELHWRFSPSSGPGGQHANRAHSRAEVRFDIATSPSLTRTQRERLMERLGASVTVVADDERSQHRNRALALRRLAHRLAGALHRPANRRPTRPSRTAVERRLNDKRRQAQRKQARRRPPPTE